MLGFILSKLNLLILVVSIFAIVSFLAFSVSDLVKINEARLLLNRLSDQASSIVSSPSYCFSDSFDFPGRINVAGQEFYYVVKVSTQPINVINQTTQAQDQITLVIFSLYPRAEYVKYKRDTTGRTPEPPSIASSSFRTNAQVTLYSENYEGSQYTDADFGVGGGISRVQKIEGTDGIIIDPNTVDPHNTVEFLKEIRSGIQYIHIFPCGSVECEVIKRDASAIACQNISSDQYESNGLISLGQGWFNC